MNNNQSMVIKACEGLVSRGKAVSLALVRARLASPVPLPDVIAGIKAYENGVRNDVSPAVKHTPEVQLSDGQRIAQLEARVAALESILKRAGLA